MEFDLVLASMPAFTQKCPSLGLASLTTYLAQKDFKVISYDYGLRFFQKDLNKFRIKNPLINQLNLSLYPLWGISNWLGLDSIIYPEHGQFLIKSLCPVCSDLYLPIFNEFIDQISQTHKVLNSYVTELLNLETLSYGFSLLLGNAAASLYVIQKLKEAKPDATIIVGGSEVYSYYRAQFYSQNDNIDFTVYSPEGEIPVERILKYLKGEITKQDILGIYSYESDQIIKSPPPPQLDLNKLPIPDFNLIESNNNLKNLTTLDILISKGCPYKCTFCNEALIWGSYRPKSARRIFEEIKYYVESYGILDYELSDNSFSSSPSIMNAFEKLSDKGIVVQWGGNCRVNELNKERISKLHHLGLSRCYFGMESASPQVLALMNKKIDIPYLSELLSICAQNEIRSSVYCMVGYPGETEQDFQKTLEFIKANHVNIHNITISVFNLLMGTPIFQSDLVIPIQGPKILNAFTYQTRDGVKHEERKARFLKIHELKKNLFSYI